ncbi:cuticular protein SlCPAP3-E4 [Spodoptera litura]|uniref:Cuticular protein SlCPAP3-E4 n=1 Tax=Spodoptera litura TaxID=69820 RepID=A0A4U7BDI6_SPOLT|nr:cuticular protein SlCPAP3-E4 [Spodoptera litura]
MCLLYLYLQSRTPVTYDPNPVTLPPGYLWVDFQCKGDGYYAVANECDTFIDCNHDKAYKYLCPDGLHFNPAAKRYEYPCAYPSEVKCVAGAVEQIPKATDQCPNQYGYYAIENGDCSKYIMCQEGAATVMECPMGLVFNSEISICDWPSNVPQCSPSVFKDFVCPDPPKDNDGLVSDIIYKYRFGNQCKQYIACQLGHPRLLSCDGGLAFDEASQSCIDEDYVRCAAPNTQE